MFVKKVKDIESLMRMAVERGASDLHIAVDVPPLFRIYGRLVESGLGVLSEDDVERLFVSISTEEQQILFKKNNVLQNSFPI